MAKSLYKSSIVQPLKRPFCKIKIRLANETSHLCPLGSKSKSILWHNEKQQKHVCLLGSSKGLLIAWCKGALWNCCLNSHHVGHKLKPIICWFCSGPYCGTQKIISPGFPLNWEMFVRVVHSLIGEDCLMVSMKLYGPGNTDVQLLFVHGSTFFTTVFFWLESEKNHETQMWICEELILLKQPNKHD